MPDPAFSQYALEGIVGKYVTFGTLGLAMFRLWVNDFDPDYSSDIGDFTECTADGYAPVDVTSPPWTITFSSGVAQAQYPLITFNFDAYAGPAITIYGWYLTPYGSPPSEWLHARRLDTPYELNAAGDTLVFLPRVMNRLCVEA